MAKPNFGKPAANEDTFDIPMPDAGGGFTIPDGRYEMRVTDFSAGVAKSSGNKQWILDAVITSGEHAGQDFRVFLSHSPAAAWKIAEALRALGFKQKTGERVSFTKKDVVGRRFLAEVEEDTYNGNTRSIVKTMLEHPKGPFAKGALTATAARDEEDADEDEDEEEEEVPAPKAVKKAAPKAAPEPEEDEDEDEDFDDEDEDDLDEDFDDDFDDDEEEDEEEEEDEPVVKKAPAKKAPAPAKKAPAKKAPAKRR